jgi:acetylornithine deacetylase/succinyl-diaminopimelate desuccinylase-like protein
MDIKSKFIELTTKTYPSGLESGVIPMLCGGLIKDHYGNYYINIGVSETMFTSHLDTVGEVQEDVTHVLEGDFIKTNGSTILGADDKAGVTLMLYMIHKNIPGLYYFFVEEEAGGLGSGAVIGDYKFKKYKRVISFDRRGISSVITHQSGTPCCSTEFGNDLVNQIGKLGLNLYLDNSGSFSDSFTFNDVISNCTNISVGYYNEHTNEECLNITYLIKLADILCRVEWEKLKD